MLVQVEHPLPWFLTRAGVIIHPKRHISTIRNVKLGDKSCRAHATRTRLKPNFDFAALNYIQKAESNEDNRMDTYRPTANLLKAIAHPARLRILNALAEDEECVCHLTALLRQRQAYVSQQLMFLRQAGLIEDRKDRLRVYYRIKNPGVIAVLDAVNKLTGAKRIAPESKVMAACPCPKCETAGQRKGGKQWRSKSSARVARTA